MSGKHRKAKKQRYIKGAVFGHGRSPKTPPPPMKPIGQVRRVVDTDEGLSVEFEYTKEGELFIKSIRPIAMKNELFFQNISTPVMNITPPKKRWFK